MITSATPSDTFFDHQVKTPQPFEVAITEYPRFRRGQVWIVAFGPTVGHELRKTRPAVVVSADRYNTHVRNRTVVLVPLKGKAPDKPVRYDQVAIMAPEGGLWKDSVTVTNQVRSVSMDRLVRRLGELRKCTMDAIAGNMALVLDLA